MRNESRRDETGRGRAPEIASTRTSTKGDADHRSGGKTKERESHKNGNLENTPCQYGERTSWQKYLPRPT